MVDAYRWQAVYEDGSTFDEFDEHGTLHGFVEVDHTLVTTFRLMPYDPTLPIHEVKIDVNSGMRPIFFRRRLLNIDLNRGVRYGEDTIHCLGWVLNGISCYVFIRSDGSVIISTDLNAV